MLTPTGGMEQATPATSQVETTASAPDAGGLSGASQPDVTAPASQPAAQPASNGFGSVMEYLKPRLGEAASRFTDDRQLLDHLWTSQQQYQQARPYIEAGQQYLQHASKFQEWLASQQQPQATKADEPWHKQFWNAPEYNPAWERFLEVDEQGNVRAKPGAPPDLPMKYLAHQHYVREQLDRFRQNPFEFFHKPIETVAEQVATRIFEQKLKERQEQYQAAQEKRAAEEYVQRNAGVFYQTDPMTGQQMRSPIGQQFTLATNYVNPSLPVDQQAYIAETLLIGEAARRQQQAAAAQKQQQIQAGQGAKDALLAQGRTPQHAGSLNNGAANGTGAVPQNGSVRLEDLILQNLRANGLHIPDSM